MTTRKTQIEQIMANLHTMKNKMHAEMMHHEGGAQITRTQLMTLYIIEQHSHIGIKEVAKKLHISSSAATQLVDTLVSKNLVLRTQDEKDRRALHLSLSEQGVRQINEFKDHHTASVAKLFEPLTEEELTIYIQIQDKILRNIHEEN